MTEHPSPSTQSPNLLGVDVGFSKTSKTTGLAWRVNGKIDGRRTGSSWEARAAALPIGVSFDLAAFDAPLVPAGPDIPRRSCEAVFYRGAFGKRCRPGMSHFGQGLTLRQAGSIAVQQFHPVVTNHRPPTFAAVAGAAMVEAFPNTFMGVLLPDAVLAELQGKRSGKSDRLYEACIAQGAFLRLLGHLDWPADETIKQLAAERDHDIRAAYVCLLTAGLAHAGTATVVGDDVGGWFWLPPLHLWADWAMAAVSLTIADARKRGFPSVVLKSSKIVI